MKTTRYIRSRAGSLLALALVLFGAATAARAQTCATPGKDGPLAAASGVVNTYFPGVSANGGTTSIAVSAVSNVNSAATPIAAGDLLLVIQMQDAAISSTNDSNYGANNGSGAGFTSGAAGTYEFLRATNAVSTAGGTITTGSALLNTYASAAATGTHGQQTFQVVRVPQYSYLKLAGTITAAAWDGKSGGIVAFDVAGTFDLNGLGIDVSGKGFRGGEGRSVAGGAGSNTDFVNSSANNNGGSKGEGIAGTPRYVWDGTSGTDTGVEGYPGGSVDRGAPGNSGGGGTDGDPVGNDQNSGGGGGSNYGAGGQGGNSWSSNLAIGGRGGAGFTVAASNRIVMGGGGGAGSSNNGANLTSSGGPGGGIVVLRAGTIAGTGTATANGTAAPNVVPTCCDDGAGGGGAAGSIIITANNTAGLAGVTAHANGGKGGNTFGGATNHGPGGGGGGGTILSNGGLGGTAVAGGSNGTTNGVAYNSTSGATGLVNTAIANTLPGTSSGAQCVPSLTVTKATTTPSLTNTASGVTATYTITASNLANHAAATSVSLSDPLPEPVANGFTFAAAGTVTLTGGATRPSTTNPAAGATVPAFGTFTIPGGGSVSLTFTVTIASSVAAATYQNPATATYDDPARTVSGGTATASYNPASSSAEDVTIVGAPSVALVKSCSSPANCTTQPQPPGTDLTYTIAFTNSGGQAARNLVVNDIVPANTDYKVGSAIASLGTTGLTVAITFSNDSGATYAYAPVSSGGGAAAGYDRSVTNVRWTFTGNLSQTAPNNAGSVSFVTRIR